MKPRSLIGQLVEPTLAASVVIPTFRQGRQLDLILRSLRSQEGGSIFEVIVVDDGSEARMVAGRHAGFFPRFLYVWQQDRGFRAARARNLGMRLARGEIIILLDGDMVPSLDFVARHVKWHRRHPGRLFGAGRLRCRAEAAYEAAEQWADMRVVTRVLRDHAYVNDEEEQYRADWYSSELPWKAVFSSNLSFRSTEALQYNDYFRGWGIEDWDIGYRFGRLHGEDAVIYDRDGPQAIHIDAEDAVFNCFRLNDHDGLVMFARNVLRFIDDHPEADLSSCAIALTHYAVIDGHWTWVPDEIRDIAEATELLRVWLDREGVYARGAFDCYRADPPASTLVIATYEQPDSVELSMTAVAESADPTMEVIVCDDGSCEAMFERIRAAAATAPMPVTYCWQPHRGFRVAASRNNGLDLAEGKCVILADGDTILPATSLGAHVSAHRLLDGPNVVAGTRFLLPQDDFERALESAKPMAVIRSSAKPWPPEENWRRHIRDNERYGRSWRLGITCNLSLSGLGGTRLDERFVNRFGNEDLEFTYRLVEAGASVVYREDIVGYHVGRKLPGCCVHIGASHEELVIHAETCLYFIDKHPTDAFLGCVPWALAYYWLAPDEQWSFDIERERIIDDVIIEYRSWQDRHQADVLALLRRAGTCVITRPTVDD